MLFRSLERLRGAELLAGIHQTRHFNLDDVELLAAELGELHVLDLGILRHLQTHMRKEGLLLHGQH